MSEFVGWWPVPVILPIIKLFLSMTKHAYSHVAAFFFFFFLFFFSLSLSLFASFSHTTGAATKFPLGEGSDNLRAARSVFVIARRRLTTAITNANIGTAVSAWCSDPTTAAATYGDISGWDTSSVTDGFYYLIYSNCGTSGTITRSTFDEDISSWDTSSATTMSQMFRSAEALLKLLCMTLS